MEKEFLVKGAKCRCKFGTTPGILDVHDNMHFKINGAKKAATTNTLGNVFVPPGFGMCNSSFFSKPCVPAVTNWSKPHKGIKTSFGANALTNESKATCALGIPDCIEPFHTGQIAVPGKKDMCEASVWFHADLNPMGDPLALTEHQIPYEASCAVVQSGQEERHTSVTRETTNTNTLLLINSASFTGNAARGNQLDVVAGVFFGVRVTFNRALQRGEVANLKFDTYRKEPGSDKYTQVDMNKTYCKAGDIIDIMLPESHAGAKIAISFYINSPYEPNESRVQPTVLYANVKDARGVGIDKVYWSEREPIFFRRYASVRTKIDRNEDAFLHIHTYGMYGQRVSVELWEYNYFTPSIPLDSQTVTILDNVLCLSFSMWEAHLSFIGQGHSTLLEGKELEFFVKVKPADIANAPTVNSSIIHMNFRRNRDNPALSTVDGTKKFVIRKVEEEVKEEEKDESVWHDPVLNPMLCLYSQNGYLKPWHGSFGRRIRDGFEDHAGVDLFALPNTNVYACVDCTVARVYTSSGRAGRVISLKVKDTASFIKRMKTDFTPLYAQKGELVDDIFIYGGSIYLVYMHLNEFKVEQGQEVQAGDVIGLSGTSSANGVSFPTKNPHLHFEISNTVSNPRLNGKCNPIRFFDPKNEHTLTEADKKVQLDAKNKGY